MAVRMIRTKDDDVLYKKCKEVKIFDKKLSILLDDMYETMRKGNGVGLAAPQVGILKKAVVIQVDEKEKKVELVNPVILSEEGMQDGEEGCLSVPGIWGMVQRPMKVKIKAQDRNGNYFELSGEGLLARAICHEVEHLDGHLFLEKVTEFVEHEN